MHLVPSALRSPDLLPAHVAAIRAALADAAYPSDHLLIVADRLEQDARDLARSGFPRPAAAARAAAEELRARAPHHVEPRHALA